MQHVIFNIHTRFEKIQQAGLYVYIIIFRRSRDIAEAVSGIVCSVIVAHTFHKAYGIIGTAPPCFFRVVRKSALFIIGNAEFFRRQGIIFFRRFFTFFDTCCRIRRFECELVQFIFRYFVKRFAFFGIRIVFRRSSFLLFRKSRTFCRKRIGGFATLRFICICRLVDEFKHRRIGSRIICCLDEIVEHFTGYGTALIQYIP